ncbi:hypothetical protein ABK040_000934 [Willaertia magna]
MSAETLEEGDANALAILTQTLSSHHDDDENHQVEHHIEVDEHILVACDEEDDEHHQVEHHEDAMAYFQNENDKTTTNSHDHIHSFDVEDDNGQNHSIETLLEHAEEATEHDKHHNHILHSSSFSSPDEKEELLNKIKTLEEKVKHLEEDNKQKQNTIQLLTQQNMTYLYQAQLTAQYYGTLPPTTPTTPLTPSTASTNPLTNPLTNPFLNPLGPTTNPLQPPLPLPSTTFKKPSLPPTSSTTSLSSNNNTNNNATTINTAPTTLPTSGTAKNATSSNNNNSKNSSNTKASPGGNTSLAVDTTNSSNNSNNSCNSAGSDSSPCGKRSRNDEEDEQENQELLPTKKTTTAPIIPPKQPPKGVVLPPRSVNTLPPPPSLDPYTLSTAHLHSFPYPPPPPSAAATPLVGGVGLEPLVIDPLLGNSASNSGDSSGSATSPNGSHARKVRTKKVEDMIDSLIGVDNIENVNPVNVETEIRKLFSKVNNGGKRGILAVHAGDGLDVVMEAVKHALEQVDVLKNRAVMEYNGRRETRSAHCVNIAVNLLYSTTRGVVSGLLQLLDSNISQLMDGTRDNWGIEMAKLMEKSWLDLFTVVFVESEQSSYTQLGALLDVSLTQNCLEDLQSFGKSLSYFKFDHLTRVFNTMFSYMKKNNSVDWYLNFCLQIRYYKEYCSKMIELGKYQECFDTIVNKILTGNSYAVRTGDYKDEDKTYLVEFAVKCLRHVYKLSQENNSLDEVQPVDVSTTTYTEMIDKIMGSCVNVNNKRVLYPRELLPILRFLLEIFPSKDAFIDGGGIGETGQDIRHITFIADLLFIMSRSLVEIDEYNESIDSVKSVGRKIALECTDLLLERLSIAQICEKVIWIPIHQEEKDYSWKSLNEFTDTLQVKQDEGTTQLRERLLEKLKHLLPGVSHYLKGMLECLSIALNFKIENRNNTSYEQFFTVMKKIGLHYLKSQREAQWEELLAKVYFIHSRKVKLKKMLKQWNNETMNKRDKNANWYDKLLDITNANINYNDDIIFPITSTTIPSVTSTSATVTTSSPPSRSAIVPITAPPSTINNNNNTPNEPRRAKQLDSPPVQLLPPTKRKKKAKVKKVKDEMEEE